MTLSSSASNLLDELSAHRRSLLCRASNAIQNLSNHDRGSSSSSLSAQKIRSEIAKVKFDLTCAKPRKKLHSESKNKTHCPPSASSLQAAKRSPPYVPLKRENFRLMDKDTLVDLLIVNRDDYCVDEAILADDDTVTTGNTSKIEEENETRKEEPPEIQDEALREKVQLMQLESLLATAVELVAQNS